MATVLKGSIYGEIYDLSTGNMFTVINCSLRNKIQIISYNENHWMTRIKIILSMVKRADHHEFISSTGSLL